MVDNKKLVINLAPTGMIPTKEMTEHVPVAINEIVENVLEAYEIGITMVHIHARDDLTGKPTYKKNVYGRIIEGIRSYAQELIICVSTSGRDLKQFEKRAEPLFLKGNLKPDMGSLTLSSLNFNKVASVNDPEIIMQLAMTMRDREILPEMEAFDTGMVNFAKYLNRKGIIQPPHYFNLLLGNIACAQADLLHAGIMVRDLPENSHWCMAGIGDSQLSMNAIAIATGGGVRVGLEDNIWYDLERTKLATNADLVKRIHYFANANEREFMTPSECRKKLGLRAGGSDGYGTKPIHKLEETK